MGDDVTRSDAPQEEPPFPLTDVDKWVLSQTDEEFKKHDWDDLKQIIGASVSRAPRDMCKRNARLGGTCVFLVC